jgi:hypothetical protein
MAANRENTGKVGKGKPPKHSQFKAGESGNPNGRPKKIPAIDELLAEILSEEKDGLSAARQVIIALVKKAKSGDVRAAEVLFDRAYGKVKQPIENSGNQDLTIRIVRSHNKSQQPAPDAGTGS